MKIGQTIVIFLLTLSRIASGFLRVCYYTNWSQYRPGVGKFTPDNVDPTLCSHIIFAFAKVEGNTLIAQEWNDESTAWTTGMYTQINAMKKKHPHLNTLIAVGGWNAGSLPFSDIALTAASRKEFVNNTQHFLRERNFDGLDIDWEYPTHRGGRPEDKQNLVLLLNELATAFEHDAYHTGRPKHLLSAAVPAGKKHIDSGFDIPSVARSLDFINVMAYDLHGSWEASTGHNSPLFARTIETGTDATMNIEWALNYWARMGAPKHKLIVGLGIYGRSFKLANPLNNVVGSAAVGAGRMGNYTKEDGFMAYYEVCQELSNGGVRVWNAEHKVPYMYNGDLWVGYDDEESVREKVKWTRQQGFGGMMIWSLALDDFSGAMCKKGPYPLLSAINDELKRTTQPNTMEFIDPTLGGGNKAVLSGVAATPPAGLLTNPPEAHAFEHRPVGGHSHHMHTSPVLTNGSGIDLQQLSSLPHISILDHHQNGNSHSMSTGTTPKPGAHNDIPFSSQSSLADLFAELIHAPANQQTSNIHHSHNSGGHGPMDFQAPPTVAATHPASDHHNRNIGGTNLMDVPAPSLQSHNSAPLDPSLDLMPAGLPPQGTITVRDVQPASLPGTLIEAAPLPVLSSAPDIQIVGNPNSAQNVDALRALGNIGVMPVIGQLGRSLGHFDNSGDIPNISFSTRSNSSSSSSSSTSSSNSNSQNVSIGLPGQSSDRLNLQDVLNSERPTLHDSLFQTRGIISSDPLTGLTSGSSIPDDSIFSILDGGLPASRSIELPSGSVGTVIPIGNDDNLARVLSSLGVSLPTSNNVLLPEESIVLTPDRVMDELAFGNVLQLPTANRLPVVQQRRRIPVASRTPTIVSEIPTGIQRRNIGMARLPAGITRTPTIVPRIPTGISRSPTRVSRLPTRVTRRPTVLPQQQPSIQRQGISQRNSIQQPLSAINQIRSPSFSRSNSPQRRRLSLDDLISILERRRDMQRALASRPRRTNQLTGTRASQLRGISRPQQPTVSQTRLQQSSLSQIGLQRPALSQQRLIRPAVSRRPIQRVPLSQLGLRTRSSNQGQAVVRRTVPDFSTNGLTLVNSGSLPQRLQRMFVNRG